MISLPENFAVLFDMDGVIFDTETLVQTCWSVVADKYGIPHITDACNQCLGLNAPATVKRFKEIYGTDFPYAAYKSEVRELFFGEYYGDHLPVKQGVYEVLAEMKKRKIPTALATSTSSIYVEKELNDAGLYDYFDIIITGDMVTKSKPDPEIFLKAAKALHCSPARCFVIEDSFNGVRAGHAAGMNVIMIPDMVEPTGEIRAMSAEVLSSFSDLKILYEK